MDVREVQEQVACLPTERLEAEITTQAGNLAAAECRWLLHVAEFDHRKGYEAWGCWSAAMWLGWKCGLAPRAAKEKVRVARALQALPAITDAFARGELSYSQVRALTRVAESATEATLLMWARHATAAQLERLVRGYRRCLRDNNVEEAAAADARHDRRFLRTWYDDDGALCGSFRLDPEEGAAFVTALEAVERGCSAEHPPAETDPATRAADNPPGARRADALVAMAERAVAGEGGSLLGADRHLVVVHADAPVLDSGGPGRCELEDGPALAPETARRLACDGSIVTVFEDDDGKPVAIGKQRAAVPRSLRRAARARDQGRCQFPGCCRPARQLHHLKERAKGGEHSLWNLTEVCWFHHRLVHEGGWSVMRDESGALCFTRPDGSPADREIPEVRPIDGWLAAWNAQLGIDVDADTLPSRWEGDGLDLVEATSRLMWERERGLTSLT